MKAALITMVIDIQPSSAEHAQPLNHNSIDWT